MSIPNGDCYFLLDGSAQCKSCRNTGLIELVNSFPSSFKDATTVITIHPEKLPANLADSVTVLIDKERRLDNVRLPIGTLTVLHVSSGEITRIESMNSLDVKPLIELFEP